MEEWIKKSDVLEMLSLPSDILYDHIYELKGVMLFVTKKEYKEIAEKELIFIKNTIKPFVSKEYQEQFKMKLEYNELLNNFKKIE